MTRSAFLFKLLAAVGIGQSSNVIQTPVKGPLSDGQGGCFTNHKHVLGDIKRVPCKEGDEYCPIGHSQKPTVYQVRADVEERMKPFIVGDVYRAFPISVCSVCGIAYVPTEKK